MWSPLHPGTGTLIEHQSVTDRAPVAEAWTWQLQAQCRNMPSVVFYPPDGERGRRRQRREQRAKLICRKCPVIRDCLAHALQWPEEYGIWAATTPAERQNWLGTTSSS
jgi:WhiB family redox-sensing transcriptional regulator